MSKRIGVEIKIEGIRKIKTGRKERGKMVLIKIRIKENKGKIMKNKMKLKEKDI